MINYLIRPIKLSDAEGINDLRRMAGVFENILGVPSERISQSESFISNMDGNQHVFAAVTKDENGKDIVIGCAALSVEAMPRKRHSGTIGIMIHKKYQNIGVGGALMRTIIDVGENWLMLQRLELSVFEDNEVAIHLYEKLGFEKEGLKRRAAIRNGEFANEFIMSKIK